MLNRPTVKATATLRPVRSSTELLSAVSPSGPGPPKAPSTSQPKPAAASRPVAAMAKNEIESEARTARIDPQSGSRAGANSRARRSGTRRLLPEHEPPQLLVGGVGADHSGE